MTTLQSVVCTTTCILLALAMCGRGSLGEIQYRQYRILSGYDPYYYKSSYYTPAATQYVQPQSVYVNPYRYTHTQRYTTPVRYTSSVGYPVRAHASNTYNDDKVYITDMYGRTTVTTDAQYRRQYVDRHSYARYTADAPSTICSSSTCGSNAQCSMVGGRPVCSCFRGYMGDPLHHCTKAECLDNSECRGHQHCKNERCVDPCIEICGANAHCETRNHVPVCSCPSGYTGDPFTHCRHFDPEELCHPSPCGHNTQCEVVNGIPTCKCLPGYHGSPIAGCRHECETSSECGFNLACIDFKCQNPCHSQCGVNADCDGVRNNAAVCKCPRGYFGNPYASCKAECVGHSDCPRSKPACFYNQCKNPCDGVCGIGANCELRDITPICSCPKDMTGDPFVRCRPFEKRDLCEPNPCGQHARCEPGYDRHNEERPVCTCLPGYQGDPLRGCVRGECTEDIHCPDHQACFNYKCQNPCTGQCGSNAECMPRRHLAVCTCPPGYNGDALTNCYKVTGTSISRRYYRQVLEMEKEEQTALMKQIEAMEKLVAEDLKETEAKPDTLTEKQPKETPIKKDYTDTDTKVVNKRETKPERECTENTHCPDHQACFDYKCQNPCTEQCGSNAECMPRRHVPVCSCPPGYNGDPFTNCYKVTGTSINRRSYRQVLEMEKEEQAALTKQIEAMEKLVAEDTEESEAKPDTSTEKQPEETPIKRNDTDTYSKVVNETETKPEDKPEDKTEEKTEVEQPAVFVQDLAL